MGNGASQQQAVIESHPIGTFVCDAHLNPKAERNLSQLEPLLNVSLSSRCLCTTFKSALTKGGAAAGQVIGSPTCSHPALVSFISGYVFCFLFVHLYLHYQIFALELISC